MKSAGEPGRQADERFRVNFKAARERAGLTQEAVARAMAEAEFAFVQQTIARIELGRRKVSFGEAVALARAVGSTADALSRPPGLALEGWRILDAARQARESHATITVEARKFRDARARLERAAAKAAKDGTAHELADELSVGKRALTLDLDSALKEDR
jgi:transcriptional regulator with XRE-family HTH domain